MLPRDVLARSVPECGEAFDVIVAGGGPAGIGAAVASSRTGAKTLLLEARSFLGGVGSLSMWMPFNRMFVHGESRGGVHELLVRKLESYGPDAYREGRHLRADYDGLDIHPDYMRLAAFELLDEAGCHYRLYSPVTDVVMAGDAVTGVVTQGKRGRCEFSANVVVDATGDGDVAFRSGAEYMEGRETDGLHMSIANAFALANVDQEKVTDYWINHWDEFMAVLEEARAEGYWTAGWYSFDKGTIPGVVSLNNGGAHGIGNLDGTAEKDLTVVERYGAKIAVDFVRLARAKKLPGLEQCHLMKVGVAASVRDTRRFVGEYVFTEDDARNGTEFEDKIWKTYDQIDAPGTDADHSGMHPSFAYWPYRSLVPRKVDNLLLAGRCASATFVGFTSARSMGNMMGIGQAAGVAAALSSRKGIAPRELHAAEIQAALAVTGVDL